MWAIPTVDIGRAKLLAVARCQQNNQYALHGDDIFSRYVLFRDASGDVDIYTTKDLWSNVSQNTSGLLFRENY